MITIEIPWRYVVSKNRKNTVWRNGQVALTAKYANAKESVRKLAKLQMLEAGVRLPMDGRVGVRLTMYPPDLRHRDLFNVTQCIFDGIEGAVYVDDWQIDLGVVIRGDRDKENPRVTVEVWELDEDR